MHLCLASLGLCLLNLWTPPVRSQISNRAFPSGDPTGTVSVQELQIPVKARQAFDRGLKHLLKNDPASSVPEFNKALDMSPNLYQAYYERGVAEMELRHDNDAVTSFQHAIDLTGGHYAPASFGYALALSRQGKPEDAEPVVRRGLELASTADGHLVLSLVLIQLHRLDEAEQNAREALSLGGRGSNQAHLALASIHGERQDYRAEVKDIQTYLKLEPADSSKQQLRDILAAARRLADNLGQSK